MSSVYIIRVHDYLKVGYTSDVKRRVAHFRFSCPFEVSLLHCRNYGDNDMARIAESYVLAALKQQGMSHRGEWFKDPEASKKIAMDALDYMSRARAFKMKARRNELQGVLSEISSARDKSIAGFVEILEARGMIKEAKACSSNYISIIFSRHIKDELLQAAWDYLLGV